MGRWWTPEVEGCSLAGRGGHASCVVDNMLLVFGGADRNLTVYDDVWVLEAGSGKWGWTLVHAKQPPGFKVAARVGATLTAVGNSVFLVGGQDPLTGLCFDDVMVLDTLVWEWSKLEIRGSQAPPRHSHCTGHFQHNCLLVFGGANPDGLLADVWVLNVEQASWIQPTVGGHQPEPREMHVGVMTDSSTLVVYGGRAAQGRVLSDVLVFDGDSMTWVQQETTPYPRCSHTVVPLRLPAAAVESLPEGDQASPSCADKCMLVVFGGFTGEAVSDEVLLLDPDTLRLEPAAAGSSTGASPSPNVPARFAHSAGVLKELPGSKGQAMLVFGGVTPTEDLRDVVVWIPSDAPDGMVSTMELQAS